MTETMRAAVYRGIDRVEVERVPIPEIGPREVLVRVAVCGVCGTDLKKIHLGLTPPPRIFGHETAGTIAAVGAEVTDWKMGERVVLNHHVPCLRPDCFFCVAPRLRPVPGLQADGDDGGLRAGGRRLRRVCAGDGLVRGGRHGARFRTR